MSDKKLLGKTIPGKPALTIGQIESYLVALQDSVDPKASETLISIVMSMVERFTTVYTIAEELAKPEKANTDPTAMGVVNGMIMALNYFNGSIAEKKHLVEVPEGGFTHFNPMVAKTRPEKYYVHKEKGGRYQALAKGMMPCMESEDPIECLVFRHLETAEVEIMPIEAFKENFEERTR